MANTKYNVQEIVEIKEEHCGFTLFGRIVSIKVNKNGNFYSVETNSILIIDMPEKDIVGYAKDNPAFNKI